MRFRIRTLAVTIAAVGFWLGIARLDGAWGPPVASGVVPGLLLSAHVARLVAEDARRYGRLATVLVGTLAFLGAAMVIVPLLILATGCLVFVASMLRQVALP